MINKYMNNYKILYIMNKIWIKILNIYIKKF